MTDDTERRLASIELKLDAIGDTLKQIAVQQEQINNHSRDIQCLQSKYKDLDGKVDGMDRFQASCPRSQLKWMWGVMMTLCGLMASIGYRLITM